MKRGHVSLKSGTVVNEDTLPFRTTGSIPIVELISDGSEGEIW